MMEASPLVFLMQQYAMVDHKSHNARRASSRLGRQRQPSRSSLRSQVVVDVEGWQNFGTLRCRQPPLTKCLRKHLVDQPEAANACAQLAPL